LSRGKEEGEEGSERGRGHFFSLGFLGEVFACLYILVGSIEYIVKCQGHISTLSVDI